MVLPASSSPSLQVTRARVRRMIADLIGDLKVLTATAAGATTTLTDAVELTDSQNAYLGSQGIFTAGTPANLGLVVRVTGNDAASHTLTFTPPLPSATAVGDVLELYNLNGQGYRLQDYTRRINDFVTTEFAEVTIPRLDAIAGTFSQDSPTIAVPAGMTHVEAVEVQDPSDANAWYPLRMARPRGGAYASGWWADVASGVIRVEGQERFDADGLAVRLRGAGGHPELTADGDVVLVSPNYLVPAIAAEMALAGNAEMARRAGPLQQLAESRRFDAKVPRRPNLRRVRQ